MGSFIIILAYFIVIAEILWYFTCTKHEKIPLILMMLLFILSLIPGFNVVMALLNIGVYVMFVDGYHIILKNNWFNRKFLAYRE